MPEVLDRLKNAMQGRYTIELDMAVALFRHRRREGIRDLRGPDPGLSRTRTVTGGG